MSPSIRPAVLKRARSLWGDLLPLAELVDGWAPTPDALSALRAMADDAHWLLEATKERKAPAKALPFRTRAETKEAKRAAHREETGAIREAVMRRADGCCEICDLHGRAVQAHDMHHLDGGANRRSEQSASNCIALCLAHHRDMHGAAARSHAPNVREWAAKWGYPVPRRWR